MKHLHALPIIIALAAAIPHSATAAPRNVLDIKHSIQDSTIVYPESFETDTRRLLESWYMKNYTATDDRYRTRPDVKVSDEVITRRLSELPTVIEMPFNQVVKQYIKRYTGPGRAQVAAILGLSNYYVPIFEQALEARGLPLELKYLPMIESALDPNAVSKHGATGLWQFMLGAARGLGMEVNSLVDERRDPYVASEKAAEFLKDLYGAYGDWTLAIAAYNCGPGNVNKALRRAGSDANLDFWNIYRYLSPETRGYVPAFIAANYVMAHYRDHDISPVLATKPLVTDTVKVNTRLHLNQISAVLDIPVDELRILNPQFRADIIPGTPSRTYNLILPSQQVHAYIMSEDAIRNYEADRYARREVVEPGVAPDDIAGQEFLAETPSDEESRSEVEAVRAAATRRQTEKAAAQASASAPASKTSEPRRATQAAAASIVATHKVAAGESLASIAERYGVTPEQIKEANHLRRNAVRTGQQLRIPGAVATTASAPARSTAVRTAPAPEETVSKASAKAARDDRRQTKKDKKKNAKKKEVAPTSHTVKNGESLDRIARRYGTSVEALQKANGIKGNIIQPGDKIKLPKVAKGSKSKSGSAKKSKKGKKKRR